MRIDIRTDFRDVLRKLDRLPRDLRDRATARALNRTIDQAKTAMSREIRAEFAIDKARVDQRLVVRRAYPKALSLVAELRGSGKRAMNVIAFMERSVTLAAGRRRVKAEGRRPQLRFKIKRAGGKRVIPGAFIGNNGRTVFIREGKARLPIRAVQTIDVPQMFNTRRINARVVSLLRERFPALLEGQIRDYLRLARL